MLRLTVHCSGEIRHFALAERPVRLGSGPENDFVLPFPGVSRRHALATPHPEGLLLEDLGSKNGLVRDGRRWSGLLLAPGTSVQLGHACLVLEEVPSSDGQAALEIEDTRLHREPESDTPDTGPAWADATPSSPAAALRLVRELESLTGGKIAEQQQELIRRARTVLAAAGVLLFRVRSSGAPALILCDGMLASAEWLQRIGLVIDQELQEPRLVELGNGWSALVISAGPATNLVFVCLLEGSPLAWQRDFLGYFFDKVVSEKEGIPSRLPRDPWEDVLRLPPGMVVGSSPAMARLLEQLRATVRTRLDVLLLGETGTGKELVARLIHASGPTADGPFVAINCAAIPAELLEAQLFGVRARVATGVDARPGLFLEASGGTIFLDEIGDLPLALQAKLLRVIQEREVLPLGGSVPKKVDVRVLSASNQDLTEKAKERSFRTDLYYRLRGLEFHLPPLRERREDIPQLILTFTRRASEKYDKRIVGVSRKALKLLTEHDWPGNVRELENEVERAVLICADGGTLESTHFNSLVQLAAERQRLGGPLAPEADQPRPEPDPRSVEPEHPTLQHQVDALERRAIREALARTKGNKTAAAKLLGITRQGLSLKIRRLKLGPRNGALGGGGPEEA